MAWLVGDGGGLARRIVAKQLMGHWSRRSYTVDGDHTVPFGQRWKNRCGGSWWVAVGGVEEGRRMEGGREGGKPLGAKIFWEKLK